MYGVPPSQARRDPDIEKNLHEQSESVLGRAVRILFCGGANACGTGAKDGRGSPRIDFEVAEKFLQRHTIREPVEQLLDGQSGAAKAGNPAHSGWIDPHRLFQGHRLAGL